MAHDEHADSGRPRPPAPEEPAADSGRRPRRREPGGAPGAVLGAIALGGGLGAVARHGVDLSFPHVPGGFAFSTLLVNVSGCLLIGVLMVAADALPKARLLRPLLGVGVLGGYTTFSTHVVDAQHMLLEGAVAQTLFYLGGTLLGGLAAVWAGAALTGRILRSRTPGVRSAREEAR